MPDSDTYEALLQEGRLDIIKRLIFRQGHCRFGPPSNEVKERIYGLTDLERLERVCERLMLATLSSWRELLNTP